MFYLLLGVCLIVAIIIFQSLFNHSDDSWVSTGVTILLSVLIFCIGGAHTQDRLSSDRYRVIEWVDLYYWETVGAERQEYFRRVNEKDESFVREKALKKLDDTERRVLGL